jgi:WD40 repeat protein
MMQLSIKSFWRPKAAAAAPVADQTAKRHEEQDDEMMDAQPTQETQQQQQPASKRMRVTSADQAAAAAPSRRTSPRTKGAAPTVVAATARSPPGKDQQQRPRRGGSTEQEEEEETPKPKKKQQQPKKQQPQQKKKQQPQRGRRAAATTDEESEEEEDDNDSSNDSEDNDNAAANPTTTTNTTSSPGLDGLTDYERQRAEQIARNRARLAALELPAMAESLAATLAASERARKAATTGPSQRGATAAKRRAREEAKKASPPQPRRQSSRVRGLAAEAVGPLPEDRLVAAAAGRKNIYGFVDKADEPRFSSEVVPLSSAANTGGGAADAAFLRDLAARLAVPEDGGEAGGARSSPSSLPSISALARLQLADEESVAKVTPMGVTAVALHPGELAQGRLLLAAADKKGIVALWDVDYPSRSRAGAASAAAAGGGDGAEGEEDGGNDGHDDGVFQYDAHSQYVSGLRWVGQGSSAKLLSASFDGSVRLLDLSRAAVASAGAAGGDAASSAGFELLPGLPDESQGLEWSAVEAADPASNGAPLGPLVLLATADGEMTALDPRAPEGGRCLPLVAAHDKRVHSLSIEPGTGTLLASICTDGALKVWDVRNLVAPAEEAAAPGGEGKGWLPKTPVGEGRHGRSSHGAFWAPDGSRRLLSISFDDTLAVWQYGQRGGDPSSPPLVVAGKRVVSKKGRRPAPEGDTGTGLLRRTLTLRHNNDTGRYIIPFKPWWNGNSDGFFVGEMDPSPYHGLGVYDAVTGERRGLLGREGLLTAIPARGCCGVLPGDAGVVVACTSSGRAHVFR